MGGPLEDTDCRELCPAHDVYLAGLVPSRSEISFGIRLQDDNESAFRMTTVGANSG